ncbi:MAG: trypsin-like peptidase domain-containing protein [Calothrix sp. MO_167.B12]|nr:trypsin-like peptidase domain-containing protein [Calothrix sp. MO_167.B12]
MKFSSQLPTAIIATTIAVISPRTTVALTAVEVNNIARQVTVRISGPKPGGTGVIVKKQGNTYTVVTNWHVVDTAGTYTIQTQDGKHYQVNSKKMRRLPGVDLAILQFNSNQTYQPAKIADSNQIKEGITVHAAGWMTPSRSCQESRCYNFSTGVINRILNSAKDGYGWVYSNEIRPGMSGGPVLDEEGRLVGINGRAITSPGSPGTDYLAIPINQVVKLVPSIATSPPKNPTSSPISSSFPPSSSTVGQFYLAKTMEGHTSVLNTVAFSPDGKTIASGSSDDTVKLWNLQGKELQTLRSHSKPVFGVAFSPDGKTIASASWDKTVKLWNTQGQLLKTLEGHKSFVNSVVFSPDGKTIASASLDDTIKLWNTQGQLLHTFQGHEGSVRSIAFSPDGKTIVSGSNDKTLKLWNLLGQELQTFYGHRDDVESVAFSPDGKTIVSASDDKTVKLWNLQGKMLKTIHNSRKGYITSVTFSPDGKVIAGGSWHDRAVHLWNTQGKLLQILKGHGYVVKGVAFSPDGKTIVSASRDKTVKLWRLSER